MDLSPTLYEICEDLYKIKAILEFISTPLSLPQRIMLALNMLKSPSPLFKKLKEVLMCNLL